MGPLTGNRFRRLKRLPTALLAAPVLAIGLLFHALAAGAGSGESGADPGIVVRGSMLRAEPDDGAESRTSLALGARVRVMKLRGAWAEVVLPDDAGRGWIPAANVRLGAGREGKRTGAVSGWLRRITGAVAGAPSTEDASSMGIRGLEPGDIANADPDVQALEQLKRYRATRDAAERYARDVNLSDRPLAYLDSEQSAPARNTPAAEPRGRD